MTPDLIIIEAARMCATATGWLDRFKRYERLLMTAGMSEEEAERIVTEAYRATTPNIQDRRHAA